MNSHKDYINSAFLQLSFAIKLWRFLDNHPIEKDQFDIDVTIEDSKNSVCLPQNEFNSYSDIILASENNISICFGIASITLWEAINEKGEYSTNRLPNPLKTENQKIAGLIYMIRCCFAHGTALPKWKINNKKYEIIYYIDSTSVDLRSVNKTEFYYESIGGYETLWRLRDIAISNKIL